MRLRDHVRTALASDADRRRLYWLAGWASVANAAHRELIDSLQDRALDDWSNAWVTDDERTLIRTMFNLYRGAAPALGTYSGVGDLHGTPPRSVPAGRRMPR